MFVTEEVFHVPRSIVAIFVFSKHDVMSKTLETFKLLKSRLVIVLGLNDPDPP